MVGPAKRPGDRRVGIDRRKTQKQRVGSAVHPVTLEKVPIYFRASAGQLVGDSRVVKRRQGSPERRVDNRSGEERRKQQFGWRRFVPSSHGKGKPTYGPSLYTKKTWYRKAIEMPKEEFDKLREPKPRIERPGKFVTFIDRREQKRRRKKGRRSTDE